MSLDVNFKTSFNASPGHVATSAAAIGEKLGGKASDKSNPAKGQIEITFNKKVGERMLPNRCQLRVKIVPQSEDSCNVMAKSYPIDPLGNKLSFGVRGDAAQVVMDAFFDSLKAEITG